jgi:hypothetical protein
MLKLLLVLFGVVCCYGQQRIPVITNRVPVGLPKIIPSGTVKNFVTYPNIIRGSAEDALSIVGPLLRAQPQYVNLAPAPAVLEKVATYGLTNGLTGGIALGNRAHVLGPVIAAIITHRTAEVVDVPTNPDVITPQVLIVEPNLLPVTIEFRSQSSPVNINQVHIPGPPGEIKETRSEEEPDRVLHEVIKPVIQEVREIIQPFRKITQEILPVQEEVHSVVARGENHKVLQEVAIPAPVPVQLHASAPILSKAIVAEPVITSLGQSIPALSRTVVKAGLIGGARVLEAPLDDPIPSESLSRRSGRKITAPAEAERDLSVNNRGPARPVKRHVLRK